MQAVQAALADILSKLRFFNNILSKNSAFLPKTDGKEYIYWKNEDG